MLISSNLIRFLFINLVRGVFTKIREPPTYFLVHRLGVVRMEVIY